MKRTLSILLALLLVLSCAPFAFAEDTTIYGTTGDLVWTLDSKGTLTINGTGIIPHGSSGEYYPSWEPYSHNIVAIVIEDGVTSIGDFVFEFCDHLTSVTIPESVTRIGNSFGPNSLNRVDISDIAAWCNISFSSNVLGNACNLYLDGELVTDLEIPDSVTSIGNYAFAGCSSLTSVTIPDSVTSIGNHAFYNCSSLTSVTIGDSVTSIGGSAFSGCNSLTSATIPDSVTSIGNYAFSGCSSLTSVTIPDSVTSIGYEAFRGCSSLTSVTIPDSVTSIGHSAFSGCSSLTSVTIPDSATSIGHSAFSGCSSLMSVTIPASVKSIWSFAFSNCSSLKEIELPISVNRIEDGTFCGCDELEKIIILNRNCTISDSSDSGETISAAATIYGYEGSPAQEYAEKYNRTFVSLGEYVHEHTTVEHRQEPTCTTKGYVLTTCSVCGEQLGYEALPISDHTWGDWVVDSEANCVYEGQKHRVCDTCGQSQYETIPAPRTEHAWGEWVVDEESTCTGSGYKHRNCTLCDAYDEQSIAPNGHTFDEWKTFLPVDGSQKGMDVRFCSVCGDHELRESAYTPDVTDPTNPTNPTEPTDPTNPTEPTDPTNPTNPINPTEGEPAEEEPELNFFQRIIQWFQNLFANLFSFGRA